MSFAVGATAAMLLLTAGLAVLTWKDRLKGGALYLFLLPLVNIAVTLDGSGRTISYDKLTLLALSALVLTSAVRRRGMLASYGRFWTVRIWVAYLAVTPLIALASPAPWTRQVWGIAEVLLYFLVFLLFLEIGGWAEAERRVVWGAAVAGCAVLFALLIVQNALFQLTGGWKYTGLSISRPLYFSDYPGMTGKLYDFLPGPMEHPNFLAGYFLLLLPAYALLFRGSARMRAAAAVFVLLHLAGIFAVPSRSAGGILGFVIGLLAMGALWASNAWRRAGEAGRRPAWRDLAPWLAGACAAALLLELAPFRLEVGHSMVVRGYLHRSVAEMLSDRPLSGYGLDSFPGTFARLERRENLVREVPAWRKTNFGTPISAHSSYLKVFFEQGVLGGLLFLGLIAVSLCEAARRLWLSDSLRVECFAFWAWGGCAGFAVQAATEELFSFPKTASLYWAMMALCLTVGAGMERKEART